jgi:hypothetical protein
MQTLIKHVQREEGAGPKCGPPEYFNSTACPLVLNFADSISDHVAPSIRRSWH